MDINGKWLSLISVLLFMALFPSVASSKSEKTYGDIKEVRYLKNYDGDTITFNIPGLHPIIGEKISIRINGIDTPDDKRKMPKRKRVKSFVTQILKDAQDIQLKNVSRGKYFRIVADVNADGRDIKDLLLKNNLAIEYEGGTKTKDWCE